MQLCQNLFLILFFSIYEMTQGSPQVFRVVHENDHIFRCVPEPEMENPQYSWSRQGASELPQGVKADGDRLYFQKLTPDLNGLYICVVTNQKSAAAGSLFWHFQRELHSEL